MTISEGWSAGIAEHLHKIGDRDLPVLAASLICGTGDGRWLEEPYWSALGQSRLGSASVAGGRVRQEILEAVVNWLRQPSQDSRQLELEISDPVLSDLFRLVTGDELEAPYAQKLRLDLGLDMDGDAMSKVDGSKNIRVAVIGAGLSGLRVAEKLLTDGFDVTIYEAGASAGGVWRENTYPGCGLDTHPYQYEFPDAPFPGWQKGYANRGDILAYIGWLIDRWHLANRIVWNTQVRGARWDGALRQWVLDLADGKPGPRADILIAAVGALSKPKVPPIDGIETFAGAIFHTSGWRHDTSLKGRRIGLIGNGSSGVQVAKHLSEQGNLTLFQRSPAWIVPRRSDFDKPLIDESHRHLFASIPGYERWFRLRLAWELGDKNYRNLRLDPSWRGGKGINSHNEAIRRDLVKYIGSKVAKRPDLMEKLVPDYPPFTKRMVVDNDFYTALAAPGSSVVTEAIVAGDAHGLWTADGRHHRLDVIVLATGYRSTQFLWSLDLRGRSGRTPAELAGGDDEIRAYMGVSLPDFPNFFVMQGPNTGAGHGGSLTFAADCQATFIRNGVRAMLRRGTSTMECTMDALDAFNRELDQGLKTMVWSMGDVTSRFRNRQGRVVGNHPWSWQDIWTRARTVDEGAFHWSLPGPLS